LGGRGAVGLASAVVGGVVAATSAGPWACAGMDRNRVSAIAKRATRVLRCQFIEDLLKLSFPKNLEFDYGAVTTR
jgi:hypothetical protein